MASCRVEDSYENLLRLVLERDYHQRQRMAAHKHIAVSTWLEALGMLEYLPNFHNYGGVEDLLNIQEADIRDLGIKNGAHRAKLVSSLRILRDKYQKGRQYAGGGGAGTPSSSKHYTQNSPPSPLSHPDYHSLQVSPEKLRADLQKELNADPSELKSRSWYHGNISRQRAEVLVNEDGDFLVRDCISRPGDFVLTCCSKGVPLHFMINALVGDSILGALPKIYYQFEEESFNSIQTLIHFYQSKAKPVTNASSAVLKHPIARSMPLSYYDSKYGALTSLAAVNVYSHQSPKGSPLATPTGSPKGSPGMNRRGPKRTGSQPLLSFDDEDRSRSPSMDRCDSLPVINTPTSSPQLSVRREIRPSYHQRSGSAPVLTPLDRVPPEIMINSEKRGSDSDLSKPPPPKPSRIPSVKYKLRPVVEVRNKELYEDDGRDYSDYSQVKESPSWLTDNQNNVMNRIKQLKQKAQGKLDNDPNGDRDIYDNNFNNLKQTMTSTPNTQKDQTARTRLFSDTRFSIIENSDDDSTKGHVTDEVSPESSLYDINHLKQRQITIPRVKSNMSYNSYDFVSCILPKNNKPLEASAMISVKSIILDGNPKTIAQHMTKVDLEALSVLKENDFGVGVQSGLEILTLPQGKQLRQDIIERCHCMKLVVMVSALTCTNTTERARMVSQWIQVANELKTTMGNLFGFVNIMEGLTSQQILRLRDMWLVLRQNHTGSAYLFDTKLRTAYNALNDGSSSLPLQNVCIPHISPIVHLLERDLDSMMYQLPWEEMDKTLFGTEILLAHLDTARIVASQFGLYRIVGNSVLCDMKEDNELIDILRTEMHLRLLWGHKGCGVNRNDRHNKFEQLLTILSDRAEPPGDDGTAV